MARGAAEELVGPRREGWLAMVPFQVELVPKFLGSWGHPRAVPSGLELVGDARALQDNT